MVETKWTETGTPHARAHRALATWASGLAASAVIALAGFLATPWLVRWLGDAPWGAWTVIGEWLGYLGLTQLAMGPGALTIFLLRARLQGEPTALTAIAKRGAQIYIFAALGLTPVAIGLSWWAPLWLHLPATLLTSLRWATAIASLGSIAIAFSVVFRGVLETVQRGYLVRGALLLQSLTITGLSLLWVWMGWGIVGMAAANVCGLVAGAGMWIWWARRWLPKWGGTAAAPLSAATLWTYNWPLLLAMLGNQVNQMTDNTVVGLRLGAGAVAAFALTQSLPLLASAQLTEIGAVSWAALGELRQRDPKAFGERVVELASTVLGVGAILMVTLGSFNRAFVDLWVGPRHFDGSLLTWATVASVVVFSWLCFFGWLIDTQGDSRKRVMASSIGSAINLGLSLFLVGKLGVAGVALGTVIAYLLTDAWFLPRIAIRHYQVPRTALLRAVGAALLRAALWAGVWLEATRYLTPAASWAGLILELALAGGLAAAYCWAWMLRPADRQAWRQRWAGLWAR